MTTTYTGSLAVRARAYLQHMRRVEDDWAQEERRLQAEKLRELMLQELDVDCQPDGPDVEIDGLHFRVRSDDIAPPQLLLVRPCLSHGCTAEVESRPIRGLSDLAEAMDEWQPRCVLHRPSRFDEPSIELQLAGLIRRIARRDDD